MSRSVVTHYIARDISGYPHTFRLSMPASEREIIRARAEAVFRPSHLRLVPAVLGPVSRSNPKAVWGDVGVIALKDRTVRVERRKRKRATVH